VFYVPDPPAHGSTFQLSSHSDASRLVREGDADPGTSNPPETTIKGLSFIILFPVSQ